MSLSTRTSRPLCVLLVLLILALSALPLWALGLDDARKIIADTFLTLGPQVVLDRLGSMLVNLQDGDRLTVGYGGRTAVLRMRMNEITVEKLEGPEPPAGSRNQSTGATAPPAESLVASATQAVTQAALGLKPTSLPKHLALLLANLKDGEAISFGYHGATATFRRQGDSIQTGDGTRPAPSAPTPTAALPVATPAAADTSPGPVLRIGTRPIPADPEDYEAYGMFGQSENERQCPVGAYSVPDGQMMVASLYGEDEEDQLTDDGLRRIAEDLRKVKAPVVLVLLRQSKLTAAGYSYLSGLPKVVCLGLQQNPTLDDAALAAISTLPNLRSLWLNECHKITDLGVKQLAKLPSLQYLNIAKCELVTSAGVAPLSACPKLAAANLWGSASFEDASVLGQLSGLRELTLPWSVRGETLAGLGRLTNLRKLVLSPVPVTDKDMSFLAHMTALEDLDISHAGLTDLAASGIPQAKGLKRLSLTDCETLQGDLGALAGLTHLTNLCLSNTAITDTGFATLAALPTLQVLSVDGCKGVTDKGLEALAGSKSLTTIALEDTAVSAEGVAALQKRLPGAKITSNVTPSPLAQAPQPAVPAPSLRHTVPGITTSPDGLRVTDELPPAPGRLSITSATVTPAQDYLRLEVVMSEPIPLVPEKGYAVIWEVDTDVNSQTGRKMDEDFGVEYNLRVAYYDGKWQGHVDRLENNPASQGQGEVRFSVKDNTLTAWVARWQIDNTPKFRWRVSGPDNCRLTAGEVADITGVQPH